jgi:hypothetical protein
MNAAIVKSHPPSAGYTNRSSEEFVMRRAVETWGRAIWPNARLVHELVVRNTRIDMAFILPTAIIGVEIKSSKDVLARAEKQINTFHQHMQTVFVALAPKWQGSHGALPHFFGAQSVICGEAVVHPRVMPKEDRFVTTSMLHLLWGDEARSIAGRMRVSCLKTTPLYRVLPDLARMLTGDEIVREVCREIRARDAFPKSKDHPPSDPPIFEGKQ